MTGLINFDVPNVEPEKRMCAGRFGWVQHRFPIKNGKTAAQTWLPEMFDAATKRRGFMSRFIEKMKAPDGNNEKPGSILP